MSESARFKLSWAFVGLILVSAGLAFSGIAPVMADREDLEDHEQMRELREQGRIIPLTELLERRNLQDLKILDVEVEHEHGRVVYEVELLDSEGHVREHYFDATSGEPVQGD